eukprot:CAMPEP_0183739010 /NCGR_PEP_ID=MMETSP0737-20130205/55990_1 /TAXON_ID=385413 /ORGANISM="Thalassiosira miniscula, Strain CCMP1093" /LENGTH=229 /DNA_ID=CAMNT_0025973681 /DNA_START=72 /DNA_END=758 /DNA_ORIENTATION=+
MWTRNASNFLAAIAFASVAAQHAVVEAFVGPSPKATLKQQHQQQLIAPLHESASPEEQGETVESFLQSNYPLFESLLMSKIEGIYPTLKECDSTSGYTIFAPSNSVMESIDSKRKVQISDPRNDEVTERLAQYHVITNGKVTQEKLKREDWTVPKIDGVAALSIGGVVTIGGELRVGRSKSGGFMGWGAKEDGGVVIGNNDARIIKSTNVGEKGVVHEVDGFVAPDLIW